MPPVLARLALATAAIPTLGIVAAIAGVADQSASARATHPPSTLAVSDIPPGRLATYQTAASRYGIDWAILAAIAKIECDHGRLQLPGCNPAGTTNPSGATGPMQFLAPTWRAGSRIGTVPSPRPPTTSDADGYATDGDLDGVADVWNPADAAAAAARYLRAAGAPGDYPKAIWAYNHADWYVRKVLTQADQYRAAPVITTPGESTPKGAAILAWAHARVGRLAYSMNLADRGGTVTQMRTRRNPSSAYCDCSSFTRWAYANGAGIDIGGSTVTQWPANGNLPTNETPVVTAQFERGVGADPPTGGYRPADLIFFGHGEGAGGHVALYAGGGQIVQCSGSGGGSNTRPLAGYVTPTGWLRWRQVSG